MRTVGVSTDLDDAMLCQITIYDSCRMGRSIVKIKMLARSLWLRRHTVHKLTERRRAAVWLGRRESVCSRINSKVSSDWLPSYIKAALTVLYIFEIDGYFPDCTRMKCSQKYVPWYLSYRYSAGRRRFPKVQFVICFCLCYKGACKTTLCYKPEGRGSDPRWCLLKFSLIQTFRPHNFPKIKSASLRNEYQEYFLRLS